ncbi:MAG: hypothetical protein JWO38_7165 [Gemmataceae bacterium]|nr:hypothetical protein [Gemmataceae bacterium]
MNKDTLKKHHFWILLGVAPLIVLIAVILMTSGVGAAIDKKKDEITKAKTDLQSKTNPKPKVLIERLDNQVDELGKKRTDLWKDNWERQIGLTTRKDASGKDVPVQDPNRNLLRWPKSSLLAKFNYTADYASDPNQKKFGDEIVPQKDDNGEYNEFKKTEVYLAEFSNVRGPGSPPGTGMVDRVAPTTFDQGWERVLRHVRSGEAGWGQGRPTSEQLWLALEDIWVQRAMLNAIRSVNDQIGTFARVPRHVDGKVAEDTNLERSFQSRIWHVALKVAPRQTDGRYVITGTLANMTDQLQLLGTGGGMTLNVWLSPDPNAPPVQFRIYGESLAGHTGVPITQTDDHVLPAGIVPTEIARVEQAFDARTVPIRRIDRVALGFKDSRYAAKPLEMPQFELYKKEAEAAAAGTATDPSGPGGSGFGNPMGPPGSSSPGPVKSFPGGPPGPGGPGGGGTTTQMDGGGEVASVLDGNKRRYIEVTQQVRRMPVAISVVIDQSYIQDLLLAYANSPLRFQITQVHWERFRGTMGGGSAGGPGGSAGGEDIVGSARGTQGEGFRFGSGAGPSPFPGMPFRPGPGPGPRPGPGPGPMGMGPPGGPPGGGGTLSTVTETQLTAGLVELTVYGVVSLYEKYQAQPTPAAP